MSRLTMNYLRRRKIETIYISNRSHGKVVELEINLKYIPIQYDERYKVLQNVDIVISATACSSYSIKIR